MAIEDEKVPAFARSPVRGKRTSEVKARVTDEVKDALQRRCHELAITESDYIDRLVCVSLFGLDEVLEMERAKTEGIVGMGMLLMTDLWHKVGRVPRP